MNYVKGLVDGVSARSTVRVDDVDYLLKVARVIGSGRPEIVANYVVWRAVKQILPMLNREARQAVRDFKAVET